ncbi:MAG: nucleoside triphosphate pyrophosphohydrolase [Oscillospiraceae bacterium]
MYKDFEKKNSYDICDLLSIMELLRSENGCPWDKEQTHASIRKNFIEEAYEAVEAIDMQNSSMLKEELGDVLLQVVFHTQMEKESGAFDFDDVCDGICKKLVLRHPHIFKDTKVNNTDDVLNNWENIKKVEKGQKTYTEALNAVPKVLPSLMRSEKVQSRAAKSGFDYDDIEFAMSDLESELSELRQAIQNNDIPNQKEELGDLLFSVCNVARFLKLNSEECLTEACDKFIKRFEQVEIAAEEKNVALKDCSFNELDAFWKQAKNKLKK